MTTQEIQVIPMRYIGRAHCSYCGRVKPVAAQLSASDSSQGGIKVAAMACEDCYHDTERLFDRFYDLAKPAEAADGKNKR